MSPFAVPHARPSRRSSKLHRLEKERQGRGLDQQAGNANGSMWGLGIRRLVPRQRVPGTLVSDSRGEGLPARGQLGQQWEEEEEEAEAEGEAAATPVSSRAPESALYPAASGGSGWRRRKGAATGRSLASSSTNSAIAATTAVRHTASSPGASTSGAPKCGNERPMGLLASFRGAAFGTLVPTLFPAFGATSDVDAATAASSQTLAPAAGGDASTSRASAARADGPVGMRHAGHGTGLFAVVAPRPRPPKRRQTSRAAPASPSLPAAMSRPSSPASAGVCRTERVLPQQQLQCKGRYSGEEV